MLPPEPGGRHEAAGISQLFSGCSGPMAACGAGAAASIQGVLESKMPDSKEDPTSSEWRPYTFARDQWHCGICGESFLYSEAVRKHIANEHDETMPPSMYEYFHGAVWQRKKLP